MRSTRTHAPALVTALTLGAGTAGLHAQQVADTAFRPEVISPAYGQGAGPAVYDGIRDMAITRLRGPWLASHIDDGRVA
ncbi:MAG: hypothetical protein OEZ65_02810 [Gemmatimonadota bacterium]|nr:hypothetical protein [Gemmatimonadota bacterium]MDH5758494.1 hypothetical protein [Gemmatimonadota bacterium]